MTTETNGRDLSTIGGRLAHARALARLPACKLAEIADLAPALVALIEAGKRGKAGLSGHTAVTLSRVLGVAVAWLTEGEGEPPTETQVLSAVAAAATAWAAKATQAAIGAQQKLDEARRAAESAPNAAA